MEAHQALPYLRETLVFLALTGILIPLLQRLRVNQVLGFLAAGTLVGPFGLGLWAGDHPWLAMFTFTEREGVAMLGEIGVLFLMFMIGLELSAERLWALRRLVFGAGTVQVFVSAAIIGVIAWSFGNSIESAFILGSVLSLSSTAVVMQLMTERRTLGTPLGQAGFSILMLQDLAVVPLLILLGVLAKGTSEGMVTLVVLTLAKSVAAIALIYLLGRRVIRPLFHSFTQQRQPDVFMALTLLSTLGIAALTEMAGLSMALGAFLAGLLLAETEFKHEVEVTIEPFKGLLMALFFMSVGMAIDVREVARSPLWLPLSVIGLFIIKTLVIAVILRIGGFNWGRAVEGGSLLGQGGEFAFIVVGFTMASKLMPADTGQFIMLVVSLSLFATPAVARAGRAFGDWWERRHPDHPGQLDAAVAEPVAGRVIIAGFGRVGQLVGQMISAQGVPWVAFETNPRVVGKLHASGLPVYFGDAARLELLNKAHAEEAAAIVLTMDHPASALHAVKAIRRAYPKVPLFARSRDERHALALKQAGASYVIPETLETGLQLSAFVLQSLGVGEGKAAHVVQVERDRRIAELHG
ncbi:cation:proton antiporter domain-containing protein [Noviherbaspirillum aridicola]|uniref:Potassium transporter TrkA n=1 Tax=Noviherbaspirillum aridicola TaxID=2849687 RepID=A0ABQ4Q7T7_9BURK|nr:cation:proton antiporter [Noviherbaspirillum aridicola]GIZ53111.1 potassium transporter TrkA [Noviherbaspirillum aridicola]